MLAILSGAAGTGKSFVVSEIVAIVQRSEPPAEPDRPASVHGPVLICAPTGAAALCVNGVTIHTAFAIGVGESATHDVSAQVLQALQRDFQRVRYVVIDEMSMVSPSCWDAWTNACVRSSWPTRTSRSGVGL